MRHHPHLFEINTRLFLERLSRKYNRRLTLSTVPEEEWERIRERGMDMIWLMGMWQRSPGAREVALKHEGLKSVLREALPEYTEADVEGSPYAVYSYHPDPVLGRSEELHDLKKRLNYLGLRLILDFVPNHVALDHPWTLAHPDWFIRPKPEAAGAHPDWFFKTRHGVVLAHGRDPYFPPWVDTAQLNFFSREMRSALIHELVHVSHAADGVRCDMAMLGLNRVFERIWEPFAANAAPQEREFWPDAIQAVKAAHPSFVFLAEAYWDLEWPLHELGFDYTYDKRLYDRLRNGRVDEIRGHLAAETAYQCQSMRFIENHDEPRAARVFGTKRSMAAAVTASTVQGLRFFFDGQTEGRQIRTPIQLIQEPQEESQAELAVFYRELLEIINAPVFHAGRWRSLEPQEAIPFGGGARNVLAWIWELDGNARLVCVNYSEHNVKARLETGAVLGKISLQLTAGGARLSEEKNTGFSVELGPWGCFIARAPLHQAAAHAPAPRHAAGKSGAGMAG